MTDGRGRRPGELSGVDGVDLLSGDGGAPADGRRRRRGRQVLGICVLSIVVLLGLAVAGVYALTENIGNSVARVPNVFGPLTDTARPPAGQDVTFLLAGTDSRSLAPTTGTGATAPDFVYGAQRSDVLMVVRISADRTSASVVSIPRDSWVDIPGHGMNKVNAAFSYGGPSLMINTVENLTGLRIDHFGVIDFAGFQAMVDSVGGIDVRVAAATSSQGMDFNSGVNHLNGAQALVYVRQRHDLPQGDLDRTHREQNALRALLSKAASSGTLTNPAALYRLIDATSRAVSVDDTLSNGGLRSLVLELRGMRPSGVTFLNAPVRGLGMEGPQSVVYLDQARSAELWAALRGGTMSAYGAKYPTDLLAATPA